MSADGGQHWSRDRSGRSDDPRSPSSTSPSRPPSTARSGRSGRTERFSSRRTPARPGRSIRPTCDAPGSRAAGSAPGRSQGTAYAALSGTTGARLFRTRDGGATWDDIGSDLPESRSTRCSPTPAPPDACSWRPTPAWPPPATTARPGRTPAAAAERGRLRPLPRSGLRPPRRRHLRPRHLGAQGRPALRAGRDHPLPQRQPFRGEGRAGRRPPAAPALGRRQAVPLTADTGYF